MFEGTARIISIEIPGHWHQYRLFSDATVPAESPSEIVTTQESKNGIDRPTAMTKSRIETANTVELPSSREISDETSDEHQDAHSEASRR